jgi:hypothetical protein
MARACSTHEWKRNTHRILVGKPEEKRLLGRSRRMWECNNKIDLREIEWGGMEWINLAQDGGQWRAFLNTATNLMVP